MAEGPFPEHYEPFETPLGEQPAESRSKPQALSNPAARVFKDDRDAFGKAEDFPHVATTYRLTEHFHYWTKHVRLNAILQPRAVRRDRRGAGEGDRHRARRPGQGAARIAATSRRWRWSPSASSRCTIDGKTVHTVGIPIHWGFTGVAKPGYLANTLTPFVGDANSQTPEFKSFLVNVEKA